VTDSNPDPENLMPPLDESVWSYRGYHLRSSEFTTAMAHFYRAEIHRSNTWRMRLDNTTNWAVVATSAAVSFALSSPQNHYGVIILNSLLVTIFLWIEARRYRYYELWSLRTRLMETDFFAAMLVPPFTPHPEWAENLSESLLSPEFPISMWEALGRRFRRNYFWIFLVLGIAWAFKVYIHPVPALTWVDFVNRAALGNISGWTMITIGLIFNGLLILAGVLTAGLTQTSGEVLPKFGDVPVLDALWRAMRTNRRGEEVAPSQKIGQTSRRRRTILALVVTDNPQAVSQKIIQEMKHSGTLLHGQGIYTQTDRDVLLVALTVSEAAHLKAIVRTEDPQAFVIVVPAQEVLGRGFKPLTANKEVNK
jgi:uncharacterized membrane protein